MSQLKALMFSSSCSMEVAPMMVDVTNHRDVAVQVEEFETAHFENQDYHM
jgi:hypothetical protein